MPVEQLKELKARQIQRKNALENVKKAKKGLTPEQQEELNSIAMYLVDIDEAIEAKSAKPEQPASGQEQQAEVEAAYTPAPGTEKMVHVKIVRGRRFNPNTGAEETLPYVQKFTRGEWRLFKKHHKKLGYSIMEIMYNPYGSTKLED